MERLLETEKTIKHWTDGGNGITNFTEDRLEIYKKAIKIYGNKLYIGQAVPPCTNRKGWYALRMVEHITDLSIFWRIFHYVKENLSTDSTELKKGDLVEVKNNINSSYITDYKPRFLCTTLDNSQYITEDNCGDIEKWNCCRKIQPKKKVLYVKPWNEIVNWCLNNGYVMDKNEDLHGPDNAFLINMKHYCGKPKPSTWTWEPEWLEEREV